MRRAILLLTLALLAFGCATPPPLLPAPVEHAAAPPAPKKVPNLDEVIAQEAVLFEPATLPPALVDRMARQRVVMLGEHHGYREHHDFVVAVMRALHRHGTRWLLFEGFQADSWAADAYVNGTIDTLSPGMTKYFGYTLDALRAFNLELAEPARLHVAFIDIDHRPWALPLALSQMAKGGKVPACVDAFLAKAPWEGSRPVEEAKAAFDKAHAAAPEAYRARLAMLKSKLGDGSCFATGGEHGSLPATLTEMVDVALDSLRIRAVWDSEGEHAAHPAREDAIKAMVDRRLLAAEGPVVLNMGGFHLQKTHVMGTPKEWLGEHLAAPSHPAGGAVLRLYVQFARAERQKDGVTVWWNLAEEARDGELLAALLRHAIGKGAFLPLDHPRWSREPMPVSYMFQVVEHVPADVFDGYVLLPLGHKLY